jgi:hypothetical protein
MNYQELNWACLPQNIEDKLLEYCRTTTDIPIDDNKLGIPYNKMEFVKYDGPDYLKEWVRENLPMIDETYSIQLQVFKNSDYGRRHKDIKRDFSYNYLLLDHPGITQWFNDKGELIDSVKYEYKKWYKHVGVQYHEVLNVNYFRAAVTIFQEVDSTGKGSPFWPARDFTID